MRLTTLVSGVQTVLECAKESSGKIAGVDICGEADAEAVHENEANDYANEKLLEVREQLQTSQHQRRPKEAAVSI